MRAASWEQSAGALATLLNGTANGGAIQLYMADLYTLTAASGAVLARWTSADAALPVNGNTFALGPTIKRGRTRLAVGIEVDALDVTLAADASVTLNGVPLLQFIAQRGLDGCRLKLERAFAAGPGQPIVGTLALFEGRVSVSSIARLEAKLSVKSDTLLLDAPVPRNVFQAPCSNTVYDSACGLSKAALTVSGTVQVGSDPTRTYFGHSLAQGAGWFDLGVVTFTSGACAGLSRTVRAHATSPMRLTLMAPLPADVTLGDSFTIYPGCDKLQSTCSGKFNNLARFRGTPYVPVPETVT